MAKTRQKGPRNQRQGRLVIVLSVGAVVIAGVLIALTLSRTSGGGALGDAPDYNSMEQQVDDSDGAVAFAIGNPDAKVTVVDYSDFSCPHCHDFSPALQRAIAEYVPGGDVRVVYKPISFVNPPTSGPAAAAAYCTAQQGKFWQMHDQIWALYAAGGPNSYTETLLTDRAKRVDGIDIAAFTACYNDQATSEALLTVMEVASAQGINSTPTVLVNGKRLVFQSSGAFYDTLKAEIEAALNS